MNRVRTIFICHFNSNTMALLDYVEPAAGRSSSGQTFMLITLYKGHNCVWYLCPFLFTRSTYLTYCGLILFMDESRLNSDVNATAYCQLQLVLNEVKHPSFVTWYSWWSLILSLFIKANNNALLLSYGYVNSTLFRFIDIILISCTSPGVYQTNSIVSKQGIKWWIKYKWMFF